MTERMESKWFSKLVQMNRIPGRNRMQVQMMYYLESVMNTKNGAVPAPWAFYLS